MAATAATAGLIGLAACSSDDDSTEETTEEEEEETEEEEAEEETASDEDPLAAPSADSYPIDPDDDSVEALWTSEETDDDWIKVTQDGAPTLGYSPDSNVSIIQVNGYAFKDLNGNGQLDLYEDWRQSDEDRASALAENLTAEEIYPLMFYTSFFESGYPLGDQTVELVGEGARTTCNNSGYSSSDYLDGVKYNNALQAECEASGSYGIPNMTAFDPYFVFGFPGNLSMASTFDPDNASIAGEQMSKVWRSLGLHVYYGPQIGIMTDPRWVRFSGGFSEDPALARDMAQSYINSLQSTYSEDGEDEGWGDDSIICQVKHFPGGGAAEGGRYDHADAGKYNVYPGGGFKTTFIPFVDGALNLPGKTEKAGSVMPDYNIYYSEDEEYGENVGVAFDSYKSGLLRNAVGDNLVSSDWDISSNFDTPGQLREGNSSHCWGVEDLTPAEREAKALEAGGIDQFGGEFELEIMAEAYELMKDDLGEDEALERLRTTARRVFVAMNRVGLFENAYLSSEETEAAVNDEELATLGREVSEKGVILLKNADSVICERSEKPTVYIPMTYSTSMDGSGSWSLPIDEDLANEHFNLVTDTLGDPTGEEDEDGNATYTEDDIVVPTDDELAACDFAISFVSSPSSGNGYDDSTSTYIPISLQYRAYTADGDNVRQTSIAGDTLDDGTVENRSYYGQSVECTNEDDLDNTIALKEMLPDSVPLVLAVSASNPMVFSEIEPYVDAIVFTWNDGIEDDVRLSAIAGEFEPSGLLPAQMPASMDVVEAQYEDVPRDMECYEDSEGNVYDFGFGLNWSGVISDERTEKYCVDPLTEPEGFEF